jgi:hypothetical protein
MAKRKADPFFVHLWDELTSAKILQLEGVQKWMDAPAKLQGQFMTAAKNAMNAALGVKPKAKAAKKAAKKKVPKTKAKAKPKTKAKKKLAPKSAVKPAVRVVGNG